jgi:hypothetical protein
MPGGIEDHRPMTLIFRNGSVHEETEAAKEEETTAPMTHVNGHAKPEPVVETRKGAKLLLEEAMEVSLLLRDHGSKEGDCYVYHEGWSDERIRQTVKTKASVDAIIRARQGKYGKIRSEIRVKAAKPAKRIEALEAAFAEIKADVANLAKRITALEGRRPAA